MKIITIVRVLAIVVGLWMAIFPLGNKLSILRSRIDVAEKKIGQIRQELSRTNPGLIAQYDQVTEEWTDAKNIYADVYFLGLIPAILVAFGGLGLIVTGIENTRTWLWGRIERKPAPTA